MRPREREREQVHSCVWPWVDRGCSRLARSVAGTSRPPERDWGPTTSAGAGVTAGAADTHHQNRVCTWESGREGGRVTKPIGCGVGGPRASPLGLAWRAHKAAASRASAAAGRGCRGGARDGAAGGLGDDEVGRGRSCHPFFDTTLPRGGVGEKIRGGHLGRCDGHPPTQRGVQVTKRLYARSRGLMRLCPPILALLHLALYIVRTHPFLTREAQPLNKASHHLSPPHHTHIPGCQARGAGTYEHIALQPRAAADTAASCACSVPPLSRGTLCHLTSIHFPSRCQ